MYKYLKITVIIFILGTIYAQPIQLIHSDRLESLDGGNIIILTGAVHLRHRSKELRSLYARWNKRSEEVIFIDSVQIEDTNYIITADRVKYYRRSGDGEATGNIFLRTSDNKLKVWGKVGFLDGAQKLVRITVEPHLIWTDSSGSRIELWSKVLSHFTENKVSIAVDSVHAILYPEDSSSSPMDIVCDSLEFYEKENLVVLFGNVIIKQDSVLLNASMARYWRDDDKILFSDDVTVEDPLLTLKADTFIVYLSENKISYAEALSRPRGTWHDPDDSLKLAQDSKFSAERMLFRFKDGKINRADLIVQALVEYWPAPLDSATIEHHVVAGDSLAAIFSQGKIDSIEMWGGVVGVTYRLEKNIMDSIAYKADMISLSTKKFIHLYAYNGPATLKYKDFMLTAGQIHLNGDKKILTATSNMVSDTVIGEPFMRDRDDTLRAESVVFDIDTRQGKLFYGSTQFEDGIFKGLHATKSYGDTFYVANARFSSCDFWPPQYLFYTPHLKLIPKDKAVARSITMYFDKLPVFWLPFMVFPVKKGRHSGLLTMDIGRFQSGDRFVRNLGYYWASSQYWDASLALDIDEEKGLFLKSRFKYALRYNLNGQIYYSRKITSQRDWYTGTKTENRWETRISHNQNLPNDARVLAEIFMASDAEYLVETHAIPETSMNRKNLTSRIVYSQPFTIGQLNLSWVRTHNLINNEKVIDFPVATFVGYSTPIFGKGERWYNDLNGRFSSIVKNKTRESDTLTVKTLSGNIKGNLSLSEDFGNINTKISADVAKYSSESIHTLEEHTGAKFNGTLSFSKWFGDYINLSPSISAESYIIDKGIDGTINPSISKYSISTAAATDIYGNIPINISNVKIFHHVVSPNISLSYSPEVKDAGNFYSFGGLKAPSGGKHANLNFALAQNFGLKLADTSGTLSRLSLFSMTSSGSYNFIAENRKFSDIPTSLSAQPANWLSITLSAINCLYSNSYVSSPDGLYLKSIQANSRARLPFTIPFDDPKQGNFQITHNLSKDIETGNIINWINANTELYVTPNWQIKYKIRYDIENQKIVSDRIEIWRDLACWELTFIWVLTGNRTGYYLRVNVKKLPEIKIETSTGRIR